MKIGSENQPLLTIGHSTHGIGRFIQLLVASGATAVADVRSSPYSRFAPQYSRERLKVALAEAGFVYTFLGKELGARSPDPSCYRKGRVQYDLLAKSEGFAAGLRRVIEGARRYRIVLLCAEKEPIECHRALLVARALSLAGRSIAHIHADGSLETHRQLEERLLRLWQLPAGDLFKSRDAFIAEAYALQAERVAYQDDEMAVREAASA